jgi:hypothetical protein
MSAPAQRFIVLSSSRPLALRQLRAVRRVAVEHLRDDEQSTRRLPAKHVDVRVVEHRAVDLAGEVKKDADLLLQRCDQFGCGQDHGFLERESGCRGPE